jgi:hypothetical protein
VHDSKIGQLGCLYLISVKVEEERNSIVVKDIISSPFDAPILLKNPPFEFRLVLRLLTLEQRLPEQRVHGADVFERPFIGA